MKNRLKVLRAERNWSQQDLADRLGVSRQSVNALEPQEIVEVPTDPRQPLAQVATFRPRSEERPCRERV